MSLIIYKDFIEITIPNSEASIDAQHVGIKDRSVGSYYMSDAPEDVRSFLNNLTGTFYIDFLKTIKNMQKVYDYIQKNEKEELFKSGILDQYMAIAEIEENGFLERYVKIDSPIINDGKKYLKFSRTQKNIKLLDSLLLGDLSKLIIYKLDEDCFMLYGEAEPNYEYKIDNGFIY